VITTGVAERTSPISRAIAVAVWGMIARNHDHRSANFQEPIAANEIFKMAELHGRF
jgi:hypothetical protein